MNCYNLALMKCLAPFLLLVAIQATPTAHNQPAQEPASGRVVDRHPTDKDLVSKSPPCGTSGDATEHIPNGVASSNTQGANPQRSVKVVELPPVSVRPGFRDNLSLIFAGALVAIGAYGVLMARRTLGVIERQAKANEGQLTEIQESAGKTERMIELAAQEAESGSAAAESAKKSADAALLNAQAVMNAERPWLFVSPVGFNLEPSPDNRLDWLISNRGRTVANVTEVKLRCVVCKELEKLTVPPEYKININFYATPIPPDGTLKAWSDIERDESRMIPLTQRELEDIRIGRVDLVAYASVGYKDQFGGFHQSRFCYYYAVPFNEFRIYLHAPAEYHQCS